MVPIHKHLRNHEVGEKEIKVLHRATRMGRELGSRQELKHK